jgi:general L-amino acid transport system substrate-binding protein
MVRSDGGIESLEDMANATICVLTGTTTLLNLNSVFGDLNIPFTPSEFDDNINLEPAFVAEQCEVWTSDASQLASFAANLEVDVTILPDIISKEPLGPTVADGDQQWAQIVDWATMATVQAWEFGVNQGNLSSFESSEDSNIRRLLGLPVEDEDGNEAVTDVGLGLPTDFAWNIIEQVGNYEDIHLRHLAPLGIELAGSDNDLYVNGGLQIVPPFR